MGAPILPNTFIGNYRVIDYVGAGGMGEVYRASHSGTHQVVAIKVLSRVDENLTTRFLNEAQIQSGLDHPNIARFYEQQEYQGRPCIIMEYIDGEALSDRIRAIGALPVSEAVFIMLAVADAIAYVHARGVIHRDIKSSNVRITSAGQVKLLDFGIARSECSPKLTTTGSAIGTLEYLSPELLNGGAADATSDIWALGILLYEMAAGKAPFESPTLPGLFDQIMRGDFVPASRVNPGIPPGLERIIARCLKKKASDRYQSVEELKVDLDRLAASISTPRLSTQNVNPPAVSAWLKGKVGLIAAAAAGVVFVILLMIFLFSGDSGQTGGGGVSMRPVEVAIMDGTADVYDARGNFKSRTPYRFDAKLGSEVKLVLKRQGYQDKIIEFKVGEENIYDGYEMEPVQK